MQVSVVDYRAPDAAERFTRSLHETGFGVLVNHPIPQPLVEKIYGDWLGFFNGDEKAAYAFSKETQDGWFSTEISETAKGFTQKDIKEYFHIYPWGRIPPSLKDDAMQYYGLANGLANLHNARRAQTPVVNIIGDQATYHRPLDAPLTAEMLYGTSSTDCSRRVAVTITSSSTFVSPCCARTSRRPSGGAGPTAASTRVQSGEASTWSPLSAPFFSCVAEVKREQK